MYRGSIIVLSLKNQFLILAFANGPWYGFVCLPTFMQSLIFADFILFRIASAVAC